MPEFVGHSLDGTVTIGSDDMKKAFLIAVHVAFAILLGGCAWVPQSATLKVSTNIAASDAGRGETVAVRVIDSRPSNKIGHRGVDSENAVITTKGSVEPVFQEAVMQGLARKGFTPVRYDGQSVRLLTVEVRRIDYTTDMEYWKGIVRTEATLHAAMVKDGLKFEQIYTGKRMETTMEAPRASTNERLINGAISDAVQRMFEDEALIRYLAE